MTREHGPPSWYEYVQGHLDRLGWSTVEFENRTGIARQRLADWRRGKDVSPDLARRLADVLARPILEVYVAAGLLTSAEARQRVTTPRLDRVGDDELLDELRRRLRGTPAIADVDHDPERYTVIGRKRGVADPPTGVDQTD